MRGVQRFHTHLKEITDDIDDGRVCAGIHFRLDQDAAGHLDTQVGNYVFENYLRPE